MFVVLLDTVFDNAKCRMQTQHHRFIDLLPMFVSCKHLMKFQKLKLSSFDAQCKVSIRNKSIYSIRCMFV